MSIRRKSRAGVCAVAVAAGTVCTVSASGEVRPDAAMLRFPDISKTHIVFHYANDLWIVDRDGGTASPLASPPGGETMARFSPDGQRVVFVGNYEGGRDLYTIGLPGTSDFGVSHRVTYHPGSEQVTDWTTDSAGNEVLLFNSNRYAGIARTQQIFTIDPAGGDPVKLPVPYGSAAALSPDGAWLAYTPQNRDGRTWNRYKGGLASDVWLFNLETYESKRMTEWDGTDTQPMWVPGGKGDVVYYLSDAGDESRINVWKYDIADDEHEQITDFQDFDVRMAAIGPGENGRGEIIFQNGPDLKVLDLRSEDVRTVEVSIPGDRPTLRDREINFAQYATDFGISSTGKQAVVEARGDLWLLPAEEGKGPEINITRTSGVAERDPEWSPDGRWVAYLSDESGEYEVYIMEADAGEDRIREVRQLTTNGTHWRYMQGWTPDSEHIVFSDKTGAVYLLNVESGEQRLAFQDEWANQPPLSFSQDSNWIATSLALDNARNAVFLYDIANDQLHQVTSGMFGEGAPTFDRDGDWLYWTTNLNYSPEYSSIDSTFIYTNSTQIVAAPLHSEVENPWLPEYELEEWTPEEDEEADEEASEDSAEDEASDAADADADVHPLHGVWEGTVSGFAALGSPEDEISFTMIVNVDEDGNISGSFEVMGESDDLGDVVTFDEATGEFVSESNENGMTQISRAIVKDGTLEGTWEIVEVGVSGTWTATRTSTELDEDQAASASSSGDDGEPWTIELEGLEQRSILLPMAPGSYPAMMTNDKSQLLFFSAGDGVPSLRLWDISKPDDGAKTVIAGIGFAAMSADGKKLMVAQGAARAAIVNAAPSQSLSKPIPTDSMRFKVSPREEWAQILRDAWRIQRDFFYDEGLHGVDWEAVYERYAGMIDHATTREDVSMMIREMISELNIGHAYYWGGDAEGQPFRNVGMLGADFELSTSANGEAAYKVTEIYEGGPWDADARGPLSMPGVDVNIGDYLLAVDGMPVDTDKEIYAAFVGKAGEVVQLTVSELPYLDESARDVLVEPIGGESTLRYRAWIEKNRAYVEQQSGGKIGYIYVPNTGVDGQSDLFRQFYGQIDKEALIIDERWNGGGQIPTRFIELLNRPRVAYWARRDGKDWPWPYDSHQGPKAMLINGAAGSGGDMFPYLFRQAGIGKLIGRRTWGGLVGISGNPSMIDGGYTSAPTFGFYELDGTWGIEGHGVDPDIEVMDDPSLMVSLDGRVADPQLDVAISHLLEEIQRAPYIPVQRPAGPDRSGMGITEDDK